MRVSRGFWVFSFGPSGRKSIEARGFFRALRARKRTGSVQSLNRLDLAASQENNILLFSLPVGWFWVFRPNRPTAGILPSFLRVSRGSAPSGAKSRRRSGVALFFSLRKKQNFPIPRGSQTPDHFFYASRKKSVWGKAIALPSGFSVFSGKFLNFIFGGVGSGVASRPRYGLFFPDFIQGEKSLAIGVIFSGFFSKGEKPRDTRAFGAGFQKSSIFEGRNGVRGFRAPLLGPFGPEICGWQRVFRFSEKISVKPRFFPRSKKSLAVA